MEKIWDDPACNDLIRKLLNGVANKGNPLVEGGDITKLLDLVIKQKGFTRVTPQGSAGYGTATGTFKGKDAQIFLRTIIE